MVSDVAVLVVAQAVADLAQVALAGSAAAASEAAALPAPGERE